MGSYRDGGLGQEWEEKEDNPRAIPTDNMTTSRSSADNFRNLVSASERSHGQKDSDTRNLWGANHPGRVQLQMLTFLYFSGFVW